MPTTVRRLTTLAAVAWVVVGGYGLWELVAEDTGDNWETPYAIFSLALLVGTLLTVVALWIVSRHGEHSLMRMVGLGVCVLAVLSSIVAWALPLWMTLSAVGYGLVAAAGAHPWRRAVALLSAAPVLGMAVLFLAIAAEVGRKDEYGDHPAAFGLATIVTAAATVGALVQLGRSADALVTDTAADQGSVETRGRLGRRDLGRRHRAQRALHPLHRGNVGRGVPARDDGAHRHADRRGRAGRPDRDDRRDGGAAAERARRPIGRHRRVRGLPLQQRLHDAALRRAHAGHEGRGHRRAGLRHRRGRPVVRRSTG